MRLGLMKSDSSQSSSREGKSKRQRISTLPIEHDFLELLQKCNGNAEVRRKVSTILFWVQFYRKFGSEYLRRSQKKQEGPKPDLEAERQAYTLFYRKKVKKGNESGTRFHVEQIPERFTELRGFVSPLGSECGPLDAEQTRSQKYYENIINGDIDEEELQEVREWEENSRREFEEARSRSKRSSKRKKKTDDETISRNSIYGQRNR